MPLLVASVLLTVPPVAALHLGRLYFSTTLASIAEWASDHGDFVIAGVGLAVTLLALLAARGRRSRRLTLGLAALAVIAAWACIGYALDAVWVDPGIRYSLFDVLVTVGVGGLLAMRWSRLDTGEVTRLGALVLFVWLVSTKGDVFSIVGGLLTVPAIGLVVLGVLLTLLTDSAFTRRDSSALPRGGRTLLWIGFLVLNLAILNWVQVTHGENFSGNAADRIFYYVGVPLAMWMAASRQFRDGEAEAPEPAAEPAS
jgi:hypothetical protein